SVQAASLSNRGTLAGGQVTLTTPVLDNRGTVSGRQVAVRTAQLGNAGTLSADETLTVQAQSGLDNSGSLLSGGALTIAAGQTDNRGVLSGGVVTVTGDALSNGGTLQGRQSLGVNALTGFSQTADGALTSGGTVTISSGTLETAGALSAQGLQLQTGLWRNQGTVSLTGDGRLTVDELDNGGTLLSSGTWDIAGGRLGNSGTLQGDRLTLRGDRLDNQGALTGTTQTALRLGGALANRGTVSGNRLAVTAAALDNGGTLLGVEALTLAADGALTNSGRLLTQGAAVLTAASVVNAGEGQAGRLQLTGGTLANTGTLAVNGGASLTLDGLDNRGTLSAGGDLTVTGANLRNAGQMAAQGALTLTGNYGGAGSLYSEGALSLSGAALVNGGGRWQGATVAVRGGPLTNSGTVTGLTALTVTTDGTLSNTGRLEGRRLDLTAEALDNGGTLLGVDALTLAITGTARNQASGQWLSQGDGRLTAATLDNQGDWQSGRIDVTAGRVRNAGQLLGIAALTLTADNALTNTGTGKLLTPGAAVLTAATAVNDGEWQAGSLRLTADRLRNGGRIHSDGDLVVTLPTADGDPRRRAAQRLAQEVQTLGAGELSNSGTLVADGDGRLTARQVDNAGTLSTGGALTLTAGAITNAGRLESRTLSLTGDSLDNGGTLLAEQGGGLTLSDRLTVGESGRLLSNGDWQVQAGTVSTQGQWQGKNLRLSADTLTHDGVLQAERDITLTLTQAYTGGAGSQVRGNGAVTLTADRVTQQGDIGGEWLTLTTGELTNGGRLVGLSQLDVTSRGQLTNSADGALLGNGAAGITAAALSNAGVLQGDALTVRAGTVDNAGSLQGTAALTLDGVTRYDGGADSRLLSGGAMTLALDAADNGGVWQAGDLRVSGTSLTNRGQITGLSGLTIDATGLSNTGQLATQGRATLRGRQFDNGGTLTALGDLTADFRDGIVNQAGGQLLSGGVGQLTTGTLTNAGWVQGQDLTLTADTLFNQGSLLGLDDGAIQLTGAYVGGVNSRVGGNGAFSLSAATIDQAGQWQARDVTLRATRLRNQGTLTAGGQLTATLDDALENTAGAVLSGGTVSLGAATVSNAGQLEGRHGLTVAGGSRLDNQRGGQLLSGGQLALSAPQLTNAGWVQGQDLTLTTAQLDNGGTLQAQSGLTLHLPQWTNRGTVQAGQLDITTDGALENRGTLLGLTRLALQAARLDNADGARLYSAGNLQLRTGQLVQNGQLAALGDLRADIGNAFTFTRTLAAGGQLTLNVTGDLVQAGTLQGNGVTVTSTGTLTQQGRIVAGTGDGTLSAAAINQTASGSIQGGGALSLRATGNIVNRGLVGTAADLLLQAGGVIDNGGLLYGGGNLWLLSDALVNRFGNILAGNSLWIQRDAAGNASGSVLNSSGTIETQRGDITVRTGTLTNQREGLVVTESGSTAADMPDWAGGTTAQIPVSWFKEGDLGYYKYQNCNATNGDRDREVCGRTSYFYVPYKSADSQKINIVSSEIKVVAQGSEGIIKSGEDIYFSSDVMVNSSSTISAERDINLTGSILNNVSYQSGYYEKSLSYVYRLNRVDNNDDLTYIDIRVNDPERFNIRPNIEVGSDLYTKLKTDNNVRYNYVLYYLDGDT
ncbi:beta strand repeat-containing protein, partial [Dickeya chrysanthemi]|uniref:beta strand repeat-containing protein n=1 Tax=Dickeya chrysanthemi TaxID=556 RepID=UPI003043EF14